MNDNGGVTVHVFETNEVSWYSFARIFESDEEAHSTYLSLVEISAEEAGRRNLAGYRIQWEGRPNVIVVVGHKPETVYEAGEQIGGEDIDLPDQVFKAFVARRIRWLSAATDLEVPQGVYRTTGPVRLNDGGEVVG